MEFTGRCRHNRQLADGRWWQRQCRGRHRGQIDQGVYRLQRASVCAYEYYPVRSRAKCEYEVCVAVGREYISGSSNITTFPADLRFCLLNAPGDASYPITGFTWALLYQTQTNADKGMAIANMLWWVIHDRQQSATALSYVPLPQNIVTKGKVQIKSMKCGSGPSYTGA